MINRIVLNKFFKVIFLIFFFSFYYFEIIGKEDIHYFDFAQDTTIYDSIKSKEYIPSIFSTFKLKDSYSNSFKDFYSSNLFSLSSTSIVNNLKIDTSMIYTFTESIGNISYRPIIGIPFEKYNIGSDKPIKLVNFLRIIENNLNLKAKANLLNIQKGDVLKTHASIKSLFKKIKYKPRMNIKTGIKQYINWFNSYYVYKKKI